MLRSVASDHHAVEMNHFFHFVKKVCARDRQQLSEIVRHKSVVRENGMVRHAPFIDRRKRKTILCESIHVVFIHVFYTYAQNL